MGGQPCLDYLVGGTSYPNPLLVEVGVLRVVPGGTVPSLVIGLTAALAMLADLGRHWRRSWQLAALALLAVSRRVRRAQCPLVVPEVVLELDLLPLVDQLLEELVNGAVPLVVRIIFQSLLELCVEGSVGCGVLRWVAICDELVQ